MFPGVLLLGVTLNLTTRPAHATLVTATLCTGSDFLCNAPGDIVVDSGFRANGVGILGANRYALLPFAFNDPSVNFTGTVVVADVAGQFIYSWGTGTATAFDVSGTGGGNPLAGGTGGAFDGIGLYLNVTISQSYLTVPGPWGFDELNVGDCNATARANGSTSLVQGVVNGTPLPVVGLPGDCAIAPFGFYAGVFPGITGPVTTLTSAAQFYFAPGAAGNQTITLPWGADFPDPTIDFGDPNNPHNFFTDSDLGSLIDAAPEPGSFVLMGGALSAVGLILRRKKR
jgi:hypothetical protein